MAQRRTAPSRLALVTGGASGLGLETARELARRGHSVILAGPGLAALRRATGKIAGTVHTLRLDVADERSVAAAGQWVRETFGKAPDILVNCAGIDLDEGRSIPEGRIARAHLQKHDSGFGIGRSVLDADLSIVRATLEVNTLGPLRLCREFVPVMMRQRYGRVVNVASSRGQLATMGDDGTPAYQLSKTALNAVTRMVADAARGTGVLVNSVCPGWCRTALGGPEAPRSPQQGADSIVWLATLPPSGPTGGFFRDRQRIAW
jgi:NAD(P)-dependent dehydrogenase (short-subunit alcohol dehydrogenase family)